LPSFKTVIPAEHEFAWVKGYPARQAFAFIPLPSKTTGVEMNLIENQEPSIPAIKIGNSIFLGLIGLITK